jgi:UDP:flavonoid glycosyltransferase YjiC (YdhE family)
MRFLLATWEGGGVVPPEMGIVRRLLARGHQVRVLADPAVEAAARAAGAEFAPWVRAPFKRSLAPEEDFLRDWEYKNVLKLFQHALEVFLCGPADRFAADTLEVLDRYPADGLIADFTILGTMIAAEARRLPYVVLVPNIYMRPTPGIPAFGPGFLPATNVFGRMRDVALRSLSTRLWKKGVPAINRARVGLGLQPLTDIWSQYDRAAKVLVLTAQAFDFRGDSLPANVTYVGPILDDPAWAGGTWSPPWPADNRDPLVLVALSSTFQNQVAVLTRIAAALSGMRVRALITLGPALDPDTIRTTANVVCVPTAPHGLIIPEAAAVITHNGHGTTLKALAAGVPLVCMPMGRDQNDTAARVVARDAGVRIKPGASLESIRQAVQRVLDDPRYRAGARRLQNAIAAEVRAHDVAAEIETALASRVREPQTV